jgi:hypothetical protein
MITFSIADCRLPIVPFGVPPSGGSDEQQPTSRLKAELQTLQLPLHR